MRRCRDFSTYTTLRGCRERSYDTMSCGRRQLFSETKLAPNGHLSARCAHSEGTRLARRLARARVRLCRVCGLSVVRPTETHCSFFALALTQKCSWANSRCEALEPHNTYTGRTSFGRVAVTYVQGPPKGGGALTYVRSSKHPAFRPGPASRGKRRTQCIRTTDNHSRLHAMINVAAVQSPNVSGSYISKPPLLAL